MVSRNMPNSPSPRDMSPSDLTPREMALYTKDILEFLRSAAVKQNQFVLARLLEAAIAEAASIAATQAVGRAEH
jgi:hypothetical protein